MERLLILEDDLALGEGVRLALQGDDRPVTLCRTLAQARQALEEAGPFALLILDVNLPDGSGLSLLEEVKGRVPVILLTANDLETDIVAGLELGAEDYITKPFSLAVLRARVNAQLRRGKGAGNEVVETGEFVFDFGRMEYRKKGKLVELSKTEQRLLRLLVQNRGTDPQPGGPGGPGVDRWCRICGGECPVCHGEAAAGQAGGGPIQAPVSQNRLWDRVYLGGEVRWE